MVLQQREIIGFEIDKQQNELLHKEFLIKKV